MSRMLSKLLVGAGMLSLAACASSDADQETRTEIDAAVPPAVTQLYADVPSAKELSSKAKGMLVFPSITKAGIGVGGEYGEGALLVGGQTADYYSTSSASLGLQLGVEERSEVLMFMTDEALAAFRDGSGWEAGVDGNVTVIDTAAAGQINTDTFQEPVAGFIYGQSGLMGGVSFEGSKYTKLERK